MSTVHYFAKIAKKRIQDKHTISSKRDRKLPFRQTDASFEASLGQRQRKNGWKSLNIECGIYENRDKYPNEVTERDINKRKNTFNKKDLATAHAPK